MNAAITAGYPFEVAGFVYYIFFILMSRRRYAGAYSLRSRVLVILAAIAMVGCVPFRYASAPLAIAGMFALAILALVSTLWDAVMSRRQRP